MTALSLPTQTILQFCDSMTVLALGHGTCSPLQEGAHNFFYMRDMRIFSSKHRAYGNKKAKQICHLLRSRHGHSGKECARGHCQNLPHLAQWKPRFWRSDPPGPARREMEGHSHHTSPVSITQGPDVPPKAAELMLEAENPESLHWDRNCY